LFWDKPDLIDINYFQKFVSQLSSEVVWDKKLIQRESLLDPPEIDDLYFLYKTTRESMAVSIMEFGSGYSTLIFAIALHQNRIEFGSKYLETCVHPNPFKILTVDASSHFLEYSVKRIPMELRYLLVPHVSETELFEFGGPGGQIANRWINLPNFTPDLIYIDGPDPEQFINTLHGLKHDSFSLPMSADILSREFYFWSETLLILDGRGANAEFLRRNLKRNWQYSKDNIADRHVFKLEAEPWGYFSNQHISFKRNYYHHKVPWIKSRVAHLREKNTKEMY
jgi:hypothetical protein